jgi:FlgD Ig-like domain
MFKKVFIFLIISVILFADLPHEFVELSRYNSTVYDVIYYGENKIFYTGGVLGLKTFYNNLYFNSMTYTWSRPGVPRGMAKYPNDILLLANDRELCAFKYNHPSLSLSAKVDMKENVEGVFSERAMDVAVNKDKTIFVAMGHTGLYVYKLNASSTEFNYITKHDESELQGYYSTDLAILSDSIVFVAESQGGLNAYKYKNETLTLIDHKDIEGRTEGVFCGDNSTVFVTNKSLGLLVYSFCDNGLVKITQNNDIPVDYEQGSLNGCWGPDNIVFHANGFGGLSAYKYENSELTLIANIQQPSTGMCNVDVGGGNIIYSAEGRRGLAAYTLSCYLQTTLSISSGSINHDFGIAYQELAPDPDNYSFTIKNTGNEILSGTIEEKVNWLELSDTVFSLNYKEEKNITVSARTDYLQCNTYEAELKILSNGGNITGLVQIEVVPYTGIDQVPNEYNISQNYPNPFNPTTTISYQLPTVNDVEVSIYDISGRKIKQWSYQNQIAGAYEITWNGKDMHGNPVPSGVYIYRMVVGEFVESKKMVLLK